MTTTTTTPLLPLVEPITTEVPNHTALDYSQGYSILVGSDVVLEGTRIIVRTKSSGGWQNLVDVDYTNKSSIDALYNQYLDKGVDVWELMYGPATPDNPGYIFEDPPTESIPEPYNPSKDGLPRTNAVKLVRAVQFYEYLNREEESNLHFDSYREGLTSENDWGRETSSIPYSELIDDSIQYRVPPETQWNREIFYDASGNKRDRDGNIIPTYYAGEDLAPAYYPAMLAGDEEKRVYAIALDLLNWLDPSNVPPALLIYLDKHWTELADSDMVVLRSNKNSLFLNHVRTYPFAPHNLYSLRRFGNKLIGSHSAEIYSKEGLRKTEYDASHTSPKTPYENGGSYAVGTGSFGFVFDGDLWNNDSDKSGIDPYGPLGETC